MTEKSSDLKPEQIESLLAKANTANKTIGSLSSLVQSKSLRLGGKLSNIFDESDVQEPTIARAIPSQKDISRLISPRTPVEITEAIKSIDKKKLKELRNRLNDFDLELKRSRYKENGQVVDGDDFKEQLEDALSKFIDCIDEFEDFNSQHARSVALKSAEYELEHQNMKNRLEVQDAEAKLKARYDWKEKWRHLFIKSLGTVLFIGILLTVGSLVHKYDWLHLPYSSLFKNIPMP